MLDPWVSQVQTVIQALWETPLEQLQVMIEEVIPLSSSRIEKQSRLRC